MLVYYFLFYFLLTISSLFVTLLICLPQLLCIASRAAGSTETIFKSSNPVGFAHIIQENGSIKTFKSVTVISLKSCPSSFSSLVEALELRTSRLLPQETTENHDDLILAKKLFTSVLAMASDPKHSACTTDMVFAHMISFGSSEFRLSAKPFFDQVSLDINKIRTNTLEDDDVDFGGLLTTVEKNNKRSLSSSSSSNKKRKTSKKEEEEEEDTCPVCYGSFTDKVQTSCSHFYCRKCIIECFNKCGMKCPICKNRFQRLSIGSQPPGTLKLRITDFGSYYDSMFWEFNFFFESGTQEPWGPNPGTSYQSEHRTAYLPCTSSSCFSFLLLLCVCFAFLLLLFILFIFFPFLSRYSGV